MPQLTAAQILADPTRHGHYGGRRKDGEPCGKAVVPGTETCTAHGGKKAAKLRVEGAVVMAARQWGLTDTSVDPGEYLLRLVSQSARRVELYSGLLQQAFEAAERLQEAHAAERLVVEVGDDDPDRSPKPDVQAAAADLKRIFNTGGVAALIGYQYDATKDGDIYATQEAIRGLTQLEFQERKFGADVAVRAVAAGLAEREVRLAERRGALMAQFVAAVTERLGLTGDQQAALPGAIEAEVIRMTEGVAA